MGVDPDPEHAESMGTYQYAFANPVMFNDPLGDQADYSAFWNEMIARANDKNSHGGYWSKSTGFQAYDSDLEGFYAGSEMMQRNKAWGLYEGWATSYLNGATFYNDFMGGGASTNVGPGGYLTTGIVRVDRNMDGVEINGHAGYVTTYFVGNDNVETIGVKSSSSWVDGLQTVLDGVGMTEIPFVSQGAELISAGISFGQGDFAGGAIGLASMIPAGGKAFEAMKIARKIQKHHIIPNAVYKSFKKELKSIGWAQNAGMNLKKLPTPFHGNHPYYNKYVKDQMLKLQEAGNLNIGTMQQLQYNLRQEINSIYLTRPAPNLNYYFKVKP